MSSNYSYGNKSGNGKDWRNYEQRRADALARQHGAPGTTGGVDNYGYDHRSEPPSQQRPGQRFYNDNYGPKNTSNSPNPYAYGNSTGQQQRQQVGPYPQLVKHDQPPAAAVTSVDESFNPIEKNRKCRDVLCLGFFIAAVVFMVVVAFYAFIKGDLKRLTAAGYAGECEYDDDSTTVASAVVFVKRHNDSSGPSRMRFPDSDDFTGTGDELGFGNNLSFNELIEPRNVADEARNFYEEITSDFENSWQQIIWMCFIALGFSILMTALLRLFAGIIIWVVVIGVSIAAIAGSIYLWVFWSARKKEYDNQEVGAWTKSRINGLMVSAILASVITALILLVFLFMRKRIALVIQLFNEAGRAVHAMPLLLLQPVLTFVALGISLALWFTILLFIETAGELGDPIAVINNIQYCRIEKNWFIFASRWWNLFMIYWLSQFIIGCQHLLIAGAVSMWFFTRNKNRLGFPILTSFKNLFRYHLGSIAFGSLVIAIVKLIRAILNWIQNRLCGTNAFCRGVICCCKCCIWCLEKFLMFLSRNAYIEIAIHGYGFCKSARKAFKVIVSNALRISAINSIGDFVLFLGKLTIVAATVAIGHEILKTRGEVNHVWAPLIVAAICAYFIAHCFLSVYEMAIDTVFICFCEDCEINDGLSKPYFMSKGLMEFVKNSEKVLKVRKERKKAKKES